MTVTTNFKLNLIDFEKIPWNSDTHDNWHIIDAILARYISINSFQGVWQNATTVTVGQRYVDSDDDIVYEVLVAHTTASTGSFVTDRTTNSTYWQSVTIDVAFKGAWTVDTAYSPNDFITDGARYGIAATNHTSVTSYDTGVTNGDIITLIDGTTIIAATHDTNTVATGGTPTATYDSATQKFNFGLVTGATGATGAAGIFDGTEATVVAALADKLALLDADDSSNPKYATVQTTLDGLGLVAALAEFPAIGDKIAIADISETPDIAKTVTLQFLFDGLTGLTGLGATPAIGDKFTVVDISDTPDATKTVTMQELFDGADGLTDATIVAGDKIPFIDGDDSAAKTDTVQGILDLVPSAGVTLGTAQATTSGSSVTFSSIPSGTKRIHINFVGVSANGSAEFHVQIGDAGGIETTGYTSGSGLTDTTGVDSNVSSTAAFAINSHDGSGTYGGIMTLVLEDSTNFTWVSSHAGNDASARNSFGGGSKSLSAELDRIRLKVTAGTFDAGEVNIIYE
tara:strand:+ start:3733 stop:5271 length:1539 start_codon:yes stop_codon:yes gene_type:complete